MVRAIRKILFASDLTENSRHAFGYASNLATLYRANIILVHVLEKLPAGVQHRLDLLTEKGVSGSFRADREKQAKDVLIGKKSDFLIVNNALSEFYGNEDLGGREFTEACEVVILEGRAPDEIVKAADELGCDMIVMGSHTGRLGGAVLGGVGKRVLESSKVPVLIVPPPGH